MEPPLQVCERNIDAAQQNIAIRKLLSITEVYLPECLRYSNGLRCRLRAKSKHRLKVGENKRERRHQQLKKPKYLGMHLNSQDKKEHIVLTLMSIFVKQKTENVKRITETFTSNYHEEM